MLSHDPPYARVGPLSDWTLTRSGRLCSWLLRMWDAMRRDAERADRNVPYC